MQAQRITTERQVSALAWEGDDLVDFFHGPTRWTPDGAAHSPQIFRMFGGPFDHAMYSPSSGFQVLYAERGTKALLLRDGELVRELDRSYYHAEDFDHPIALGALPDGREIVVHCPSKYNVLQIDDAETGQRLTDGPRTPQDMFHSRLSISPGGRYLLAAGWVWHPHSVAMIFDLTAAVKDSGVLDGAGILPADISDAEIESACWLDHDRVLIAASNENPFQDDSDNLAPGELGIWSAGTARWLHRSRVNHRVGTMIACGERVISRCTATPD